MTAGARIFAPSMHIILSGGGACQGGNVIGRVLPIPRQN